MNSSSPWPIGPLGRRMAVVLTSSVLSVGLLTLLLSWSVLQVSFEVPEPERLTGPTEVLARDGTVLARFTSEVDREVVPLEEVSPAVRNAIIAAEDARFYSHGGVDAFAVLRAIGSNVLTGSITQGGSTLTQQYVKKTYVSDEITLQRKIREAAISMKIEQTMSKDEILGSYLNTVYFGEGAYGIEAAAQTYWREPASQLTPAQGATLAQLLPAPSERNPRVDPGGALIRRNKVLDTMASLGMIGSAQAQQAKAEPLEVRERQPTDYRAPYFVAYVRKQLEQAYGRQQVLTGALTVTTTVNLQAQDQLEEAVATQLPPQGGINEDVDAGAAVVDPKNGDILALYGGRSFEERQFNNATQLHVRQAGSGFKPFVYATALAQGYSPEAVYPAPSSILPTNCPPADDGSNPFRKPVANAGGGGYGSLTIKEGLERSVNTVYVQLGCDVGPHAIVDTARKMGVRNVLEPVPNISIGSGPAGPSPLDMASAFATFANDGLSCPARSILSVTDRDGNELELPVEQTTAPGMEAQPRPLPEGVLAGRPPRLTRRDGKRCKQVIDPQIARHTTDALETVVASTTGTRAQIGRPQAGKTGTADDQTDAWFNGYTPDLSMSVWVGHTTSGSQPLQDVAGFGTVFGGTVPALIWRDAALAMLAGVPGSDFPEPGALSGPRFGDPGDGASPTPGPTPTVTPEDASPPPRRDVEDRDLDPLPSLPPLPPEELEDPAGGSGGAPAPPSPQPTPAPQSSLPPLPESSPTS